MAMEFRFDATQEYQLKAIAAVTGLFDGQPYIRNELVIPENGSFAVVANRLDLSEEDMLHNLRKVQADERIEQDAALVQIAETIDGLTGGRKASGANKWAAASGSPSIRPESAYTTKESTCSRWWPVKVMRDSLPRSRARLKPSTVPKESHRNHQTPGTRRRRTCESTIS
jgi:hypothetical protein